MYVYNGCIVIMKGNYYMFVPSNAIKENLKCVEVLDIIMGAGKTHSTLRYIENLAMNDSNQKWVYCTEFLSEIETRTQENDDAKHMWTVTDNLDDVSKSDMFKELLSEPDVQLIAITHSLLKKALRCREVQQLVSNFGWNLYIDETFDCISVYKGISYEDFNWHKNSGRISVDTQSYGKVRFTEDVSDYNNTNFSLHRLIKDEDNLYCATNGDQTSLVTVEPRLMFTVWNRIILSTYQFSNTIMESYFLLHNIPCVECKDVIVSKTVTKDNIKANVTMFDKHLPKFKDKALTKTWYEKANADDYGVINKVIRNIGDALGCRNDASRLGYTVPKFTLGKRTSKRSVQPHGYKHTECMIDVDTGEELLDTVCKTNSCYIPCNARASNEYSHKNVMIHVYNRKINPVVYNFLRCYNLPVSQDRFATNEMIQWVWRSAIRNNQPITLAILSLRMRTLFVKWLES